MPAMARRCPHCTRRHGAQVRYCPDDGHRLEPDPLADHDYQGRRVHRFLGEGAMGVVYVVRKRGTEEDEALKVLLARDPEAMRRFQQEVTIVNRLRSEHTVRMQAHGRTSDDYLYLITELVRGRTVEEILDREVALSPVRAARILFEVCHSLVEAHALQIVHRDLKPGNVIIEMRDQGEFARVLDFGVARMRSEGGIRTEQGRIFGTPAFSSPEQAVGAPDLDARSDIYSLGILLYEMLTGRNPFLTDDAFSTLRQQLELNPRPPPGPRPLVELCMGMLEKRREQRVQSADEVRSALAAIDGVLRPDAEGAADDLASARARLDANLRESERLAKEVRAAQARLEMDRLRLEADADKHQRSVAHLRATFGESIHRIQAELTAAMDAIKDK